jgi:hypothetical protein
VRPVLAAAALALAAGCSKPGGLQTLELRGPSENRLSSSAPVGPQTHEAFPFDYQALPALQPVAVTANLPSSSLSFLPTKDGAELNMTGPVVAEIEIGVHTTASPEDMDLGGTDRQRGQRGNRGNRYYHLFRQADETGPFAWAPAPGAGELCGRGRERGRARWQGYVHKSRTAEGLDYVCYEGTFDPTRCSATAERAFRVTARPLIADTVFGFRLEDGVCSPPSMPPEERLAIVGPRPFWIGSTAPFSIRGATGVRSFTRIVVPIGRAKASSAVVDVRPEDVQMFRADVVHHGDPWLYSYSVEVVWGPSDLAPSTIAFSSVLSGNTSKMEARALGINNQ